MNQKGFAAVLFLVGIVLISGLIVGGAYYLGKSQALKPQIQNQVISPSAQPTQTPDEIANPDSIGANWKYI